ncbi:MAG: S8 family serine peptidase [Micromonosporaceae bacterium]
MHPRRVLRVSLSVASVAALVLVGLTGPATGRTPDQPPPAPATASPQVLTATLLTGDRVEVQVWPTGERTVTVHAPQPGRAAVGYQHYAVDDQVYVIPSDAAPLIPDVLDPELFNVTKLHSTGHTEATPVIVQYAPGPRTLRAATADADGLAVTTELPSIDAVAGVAGGDGRWWTSLTGSAGPAARAATAQATLPGVRKVWLDEQVTVALDASVPQIGAPTAWQQGYDGSGLTVAVLDTGIDTDHPDLAGAVVEERDFTGTGTADDGHGHGTHVAGIIAGSGAASGGTYVGVAPGAELVNGKVLDDAGNGQLSWVLAGMEWAAARADVVNMSLGALPTDGTDPISQALNALTEQHGTLFVVAAGNSGPSPRSVGTPGAADAALTVGSVDKSDGLADSSSRGPRLGDWAIKPDVTAPGVGIVAPRAEGTAPGPIVDEHYTRLSGTSMATPHVAGAAAILRQADPDLTPQQVKAALVGTAVPHAGLTVYDQGGGRIDLPAALSTPVLASPSPLNLGYFPYPHDDAQPVQAEVTYTNRGDEPVTLHLSVQASAVQGPPVPAGVLTVDPASLVVPAGGSATATVTLDVPALDIGLYSGYLVAEHAGEVVARVPVGFHKEDEMYDLRIVGIDRSGQPAGGGQSNVAILDVENMARFFRPAFPFVDGQVLARVPPGTYSILGAIIEHDAHGQFVQRISFVGDPEVTVTADTELVLDARQAQRIEVETPAHVTRPLGGVSFGYWRTAEQPGPLFNPTWWLRNTLTEYYAMPTDPVTLGQFEFHSRWKLAAPEAELAVVHPVTEALDPYLLRAPAVDGERVVPLVDVGAGEPEDFAAVDVAGAAALVSRHPDPSYHVEQERLAAQAGAVALVVANDVPGHLTGFFDDPGTIPTLSVTRQDGDRLRQLLADGEVRVRLSGTAWSEYLYDLVLVETGAIPSDLHYRYAPGDLAAVRASYHNDAPGHAMAEGRSFLRPFHSGATILYPPVVGERTRTEYLIGGDGIGYQQTVYGEQPFEAELQEPGFTFYEPGTTVDTHWFRQVVRPALVPEVEPVVRTGDTLALRLYEWVDSDGHYVPNHIFGLAPYPGDTIRTRVWRDGELVATNEGFPRLDVAAVPGRATYRVELDVDRDADWWRRSTRTRTVWTFTSQRPEAGSAPLPMLSVDYDVPVDLLNTTPPPHLRQGPPAFELRVTHQAPGLPAVVGARAWVSFDDGGTWRAAPAQSLGDGTFHVILPGAAREVGGDVSVRVEAWDAAGNRVEQEVIRAWHLPDRG